jgi:hypothetical protein
VQRAGEFESAVEGEIVREAAASNHPVQDVAAGGAHRRVVAQSNANVRNRGQGMLLESGRTLAEYLARIANTSRFTK